MLQTGKSYPMTNGKKSPSRWIAFLSWFMVLVLVLGFSISYGWAASEPGIAPEKMAKGLLIQEGQASGHWQLPGFPEPLLPEDADDSLSEKTECGSDEKSETHSLLRWLSLQLNYSAFVLPEIRREINRPSIPFFVLYHSWKQFPG